MYIYIYIYIWYLRVDPKQCFNNVVAGVPWGYLCIEKDCNRCTVCLHLLQTSKSLSLLCQPWNHWIPLLQAYSGLHLACLANQQIIGFHCFEPTEPTLTLPCQPANHWISFLWAYSGLPWAFLANQQIIRFHCSGPTRAYLGPTLPTSKSLDCIASGLLGPTSGLPCQPANH